MSGVNQVKPGAKMSRAASEVLEAIVPDAKNYCARKIWKTPETLQAMDEFVLSNRR